MVIRIIQVITAKQGPKKENIGNNSKRQNPNLNMSTIISGSKTTRPSTSMGIKYPKKMTTPTARQTDKKSSYPQEISNRRKVKLKKSRTDSYKIKGNSSEKINY